MKSLGTQIQGCKIQRDSWQAGLRGGRAEMEALKLCLYWRQQQGDVLAMCSLCGCVLRRTLRCGFSVKLLEMKCLCVCVCVWWVLVSVCVYLYSLVCVC